MPGETDGVFMSCRTTRFAQQLADEDSRRAVEEPPVETPNGNGQQPRQPSGPRYEYHRPWYKRLLAKGCARCGGQPMGWVQQQIQTPYRTKRLILWLVNLLPRMASFASVMLSRRIEATEYEARQAACATCPAAVVQLRVVKDEVREASYCSACSCPKWYLSRNGIRNWRSRWACPIRRHSGSDPDAMYADYIRAKQAASAANDPTGAS